jgi:hypothetical protein
VNFFSLRWLYYFFVFVALVFSGVSFAQVPPPVWNGVWVGGGGAGGGGSGSSPVATCQKIASDFNAASPGRVAGGCFLISYGDVAEGAASVTAKVGFYIDGSGQEVNATGVCAGGAVGGTDGLCKPACPTGQMSTRYVRTGCTYANGAITGQPCGNESTGYCVAGCQYGVDSYSSSPATYGAYSEEAPPRTVWVSVKLSSTGATCTGPDTANGPTGLTPPETSSSASSSASSVAASSVASSASASSAGSSSGSGSSDGGGSGGSASSAGSSVGGGGGSGSGSSAGFCPTTPCPVKVDESGTPTQTDFSDGTGKIADAFDARATLVNGDSWKQSGLGAFGWNPQIPSGACHSFVIWSQAGNFDPCMPLGKARDLWAWCLYLLTGFTMFYMATNAPGKAGK